jgi:ABC-type polar amino acid transport system ATPase subunit
VADEIAFVADGRVPVVAATEEFFERSADPRVRSFLQLTLAT